MNGGYQILDLRKIDIQIEDEEVAITDEDVQKQLFQLSNFLNIQTGLLDKQLKPIYILMNESAGYGEISLVEAGKLLIQADFINAKLSLLVNFGTDTDDDGNPYFYLDSAEYSYISSYVEAVNNVNKGIDEGDITIPTGTKLYRHVLIFNNNDDIYFEFISTYSQPVTDSDTLNSAIHNAVRFIEFYNIDSADERVFPSGVLEETTNKFHFYGVTRDTSVFGDEVTITNYNDTVTEL